MPEPAYFSSAVLQTRRFWLPDPPDTPVRLLASGFEAVAPDYHLRRRDFPHTVVEIILAGRGWIELAGRRQRLQAGSISWAEPNSVISMGTDRARPLEKYFLVLDASGASDWLRSARLQPSNVVTCQAMAAIADCLEQLILWGQGNHPERSQACAAILAYLGLRLRTAVLANDGKEQAAHARFVQLQQIIEGRFLQLQDLSAVARLADMSPGHCCRLYRRFSTTSPAQHLRRLRLHHALHLLQSGRAVHDVAASLGYSDAAHFSRAFSGCFGVAPGTVRPT